MIIGKNLNNPESTNSLQLHFLNKDEFRIIDLKILEYT